MIGYFPKITLPSGKTDIRKGEGIVFVIGGKVMAVDMFQGGEPTQGIIDWLKSQGIKQIDLAVATHAHGDHYGGFYDVVKAGISIKEFRCYHIDSIRGGNAASREDSDNLLKLIRWLQQRDTRVLFVDHGDVLKFEDISWHIYRNQPKSAKSDDTNGWEYVNNGSLVLYSPELMGMICGDGPQNAKDAIAYFQKKFGKSKILIWLFISHHGNNFSLSNAQAAKDAGAIIAFESNVEKNGPGTTEFTLYGARRIKQVGIEVWMQDKDITITVDNGKITFKQGSNTVSASVPYNAKKESSNEQNSSTGKKFIDCSEHNTIDWSKAKSEVGNVYVRCGIRGSLAKTSPEYYKVIREDFKFRQNIESILKYGIPFSIYYFPTDMNDSEALESAKWFYDICKGLNLAFPPILDSENVFGNDKEEGRANSLSKSERTRLLKIITDYFNERGMNIGIYASASWFNNKIDMSAFSENVKNCTWVADSTAPVDYKGYYWLHQYGKGPLAGSSKDIDMNKMTGKMPSVFIVDPVPEPAIENPVDVIIRLAEAEEGYKEKASNKDLYSKTGNAGTNNYTKYGKEMHDIQPRNMDFPAEWCDCFVDWLMVQLCKYFGYGADKAKELLCGDFDDYTYNSVKYYKDAGRWVTKNPKRGYQIFFGGSGHTGIVRNVVGRRVYTAEGNKGNAVRFCEYDIDDQNIIGYGKPRYELLSKAYNDSISLSPSYKFKTTLSLGSKGNKVRFLQWILGGLKVDGSFGPKTEAKVKAYQTNKGLEVDGIVGPLTWKSLMYGMANLSKGSSGRHVRALQLALGNLVVDGSFGQKTKEAVNKFKRTYGMAEDGIVNSSVWQKIFESYI